MPDDSSEVTVAGDEPAQAITRGARANAAGLLLRLGARLAFLFVAARLFGAQAFGNYVLAVALVELAVSLGSLSTKKTLFPILDRAAQGAARLDWSLTDDVDGVIVELGANDALRGLAPAQAEAALKQILDALAARKLPVLVAGMRAPPNLGPDYAAAFEGMYGRLAGQSGALLYPFFLDGVAADPKLNQADGLHPTAEGVDAIVARILPSVEALLALAKK